MLVDVDVGGRRTGASRASPRGTWAARSLTQPALHLRGLQGYAGHCAHVMGLDERRKPRTLRWRRLMETRRLFEQPGLPVDIVTGGSSGTYDIDVELEGSPSSSAAPTA